MNKVPQMVSMEIEPEKKNESDTASIEASKPRYPYGLCITLCQAELDKLGVDTSDWAVGDEFHLHAMARITSISQNETTDGCNTRVEMQITELSGEDEESENQEYEQQEKGFRPLG